MAKKNQDKDSKVLTGALIGGIVGIGAITIFLALRREKENPLNTIGEAIAHVGDVLESHHIDEPGAIKDLGKKIHKNENTLGAVIDWVASGISLWQNFKK